MMYTISMAIFVWIAINVGLFEFLAWKRPGAYKNDPKYIEEELKHIKW